MLDNVNDNATPQHKDIAARLNRYLVERTGRDVPNFPLASSLEIDLGFDSLDTTQFAMEAEEEFGIEIADEEMQRCVTLQNVVELIAKEMPSRAVAATAYAAK